VLGEEGSIALNWCWRYDKARRITARLEYREKVSSGSSWSWKLPDGIESILDGSPRDAVGGHPAVKSLQVRGAG
jgi:hypothetical protein